MYTRHGDVVRVTVVYTLLIGRDGCEKGISLLSFFKKKNGMEKKIGNPTRTQQYPYKKKYGEKELLLCAS